MSEKKNTSGGFMPMFQGMMPMMPVMPMMPPMPFLQNGGWGWSAPKKNPEDTKRKESFRSNMKTFWEQTIDMQRSTVEAARDQWNQFFKYMLDMQETFAESLPEEAPALPGLPAFPLSPKEAMEWVMEFEEMTNSHMVEQADSLADYSIKGQEKVCDMVNAAVENAKEKKEKEEAKEEAAAEAEKSADAPAEQ